MVRRTVLFSGRVQGVGFRHTTRQIAEDFDIGGYVRNLSDGRVETVIEGHPDEVRRFLDVVKSEMSGYIRDVEEREGAATSEFSGFDIHV